MPASTIAVRSALAALIAVAALLAPQPGRAEPVTATLLWAERATLGLGVSGTVAAIGVRPGERDYPIGFGP